jgi:hypothetical protein
MLYKELFEYAALELRHTFGPLSSNHTLYKARSQYAKLTTGKLTHAVPSNE